VPTVTQFESVDDCHELQSVPAQNKIDDKNLIGRLESMENTEKKSRSTVRLGSGAIFLALLFVTTAAKAQQTTGQAGSPDATTTVDSRYLPTPPQKFTGEIGLNASDSKSAWPARIVPPKGAPNILLILTDDVGFGAPSTFGGIIPTPAMDRIAANGLRYTNFHFAGQEIAMPCFVPPKYDGICLVHLYGVSNAQAQPTDTSGVGQGGTGTLKVDGKVVSTEKLEHTLPLVKQLDDTFNVGSGGSSAVNDTDYKVPFKFTGTINKVTIAVDEPVLSPEDIKKLEAAGRAATD
jgi:hypothetical protein